MRLFAEITSDTIERIASILRIYTKDEIVAHFSESSISFCIQNDNSIGFWIGCEVESCLNKYKIQSKNDNMIAVKIDASQLAQALKMDQSSSILLNLSQSDNLVFFKFIHRSLDELKQLEHRVPVLMLTPQAVQIFAEPEWDNATMMSKFPPLKSVSSWVKNATNINKFVTISIQKNPKSGKLDVGFNVEDDTHMVSVFTRFPNMNADEDEPSDVDQCEVTVDMKKFSKILRVQDLQPTVSLLYIYNKKFMRLHFATKSISMTYILNSIYV